MAFASGNASAFTSASPSGTTPIPNPRRVLVTGGGTFLGDNIAAALLAEGAEVTLLVRPGAEDRLGALGQRARWFVADVWNAASLKGRGRGHGVVIHTVGGMHANPREGLTYEWLNVISARNVANMCVSSGVPHMVLISAARAPWISAEYLKAKREAELYMERVGLRATIIRAPLVFQRGVPRPLFNRLLTLLGGVPPISWFGLSRAAPMPIDVLARGTARIALDPPPGATTAVLYAGDLRRRNSARERRRGISESPIDERLLTGSPIAPINVLPEDVPFGWTPGPPE
ncbi:MAG: NAD(P)H-binding protein [bacterium]|nr:NAD(P)H-binding protein [bacterium]